MDNKKKSPVHTPDDVSHSPNFHDDNHSLLSNTSYGENQQKFQQEHESSANISQLPIFYGIFSLLSIIIAMCLGQTNNEFPHFYQLPYYKPRILQIFIAIQTFIGISVFYIYYFGHRQLFKNYRKRYLVEFNVFNGVSSQFVLFAFIVLPSEDLQDVKIIKIEDSVLLNTYFFISFLYMVVYMQTLVQTVQYELRQDIDFKTKQAIFMMTSAAFIVYIFALAISIFEMENYFFPSVHLESLQRNLLDIYSLDCYCLFVLNSIFVSLFYYDLRKLNMTCQLQKESYQQYNKMNLNQMLY